MSAYTTIRRLLDQLGAEDRAQRLAILSDVVRRPIHWGHEIALTEAPGVVAELERRLRAASRRPCGCDPARARQCPQHRQVAPRRRVS